MCLLHLSLLPPLFRATLLNEYTKRQVRCGYYSCLSLSLKCYLLLTAIIMTGKSDKKYWNGFLYRHNIKIL